MNCSKLCFYQCLLTLAFNSTAWRLILSEVVPFVSSLYSILFMYLFLFIIKKLWKHEFFAAFITVNFLSRQGVLCVFFLWFAANSRSSSPTSRISYLTHTQKDPMTPRSMRRSGAARSQGASREGSPNRVHMQPGRFFIW